MDDINESLIIGFDYSNNRDITVLTIFKRTSLGDQYELLNQFTGEEAKELWLKLTNQKNKLKRS